MKNDISLKVITIMCILSILFTIGFCSLIYSNNNKVEKIDVKELKTSYSDSIVYNIDKIEQNRGYYCISGWAVNRGYNIEKYDCSILLKDKKGDFFEINTKKVSRGDITQYFNDNCNYEYSGFFSKFKVKKLQSQEKYEIYIKYQNNNDKFLIQTNKGIEL